MGLIPDDVIDEIRSRADIVAVVGQHVELRRSGASHKGVCPFHGEKTPSFYVHPDKGFFYCFGCHKKGDVFTFVMEYEGKSFIEAAETLSALTGVAIPDTGPSHGRRHNVRTEMLRINARATELFKNVLASEKGDAGRAYLAKRGVSKDTADAFHLGAAPAEWSVLADSFAKGDVDMQLAEEVGLVAKRRTQGHYDRFRDRLVCPVMTTGGDVVGFSARRLSEEAPDGKEPGPKYINSPESAVYKKSRLLFGLHQARKGIRERERVVLVEGNFDVINMYQHGFTETVAPLGTALTSEQAELLSRLTKRVYLFNDGDKAGRAATEKAIRTLVAADLEVWVAEVPDGQDPDSLLAEKGAEAVEDLLKRAKPGVEFYLNKIWNESSATADGRAEALKRAAGVLKCIADPTKRDFAVGSFALALGVSEDALRRGLRRAVKGTAQPSSNAPRAARSTHAPPPTRELKVLGLLFDHSKLFPLAEELNLFSYLTDPRLRDMYSAAQNGGSLVSAIPDDPHIASHVLSGTYKTIANPEQTLREIVSVLSKDLALSRLAATRGQEPEQERLRLQEIVKTRRQVDNYGKDGSKKRQEHDQSVQRDENQSSV